MGEINMNIKKVIAREGLILIGVILLSCLICSLSYIYPPYPKRLSLDEIFKATPPIPPGFQLEKPSSSFIPDKSTAYIPKGKFLDDGPRDLLAEATPAGARFRADLIRAKIRWGGPSVLFIAYALYLIPIKFSIWAVKALKENDEKNSPMFHIGKYFTKWKIFWQIALLMIIAGIIFYLVYPKYEFRIKNEISRHNKITGKIMYFNTGVNDDGRPNGQRGWRLAK